MEASAPRKRMSAAERREQLLDVTKEIVGEEGFHAVSIEAVARRAGITRPVVYGHFDDLAGLLEAMVDREGSARSAQLADDPPDPPAGTGARARTCSPRCAATSRRSPPTRSPGGWC